MTHEFRSQDNRRSGNRHAVGRRTTRHGHPAAPEKAARPSTVELTPDEQWVCDHATD